MLKKIGRLDITAQREIDEKVVEIFALLDKKTDKAREKAHEKLFDMAKTPNYFIREYLGKKLTEYHDQRVFYHLARKMLQHKLYGIRATALFYFYNRYFDDPDKVLGYLEECHDTVPWEVESVINDIWRRFPKEMKKKMLLWLDSNDEKRRALSFHGMENIASRDPLYIMNFLDKAIDDKSVEVQKKITHILTQVARSRPADCYPYIYEWLLDADDTRMKTIWVSMKKLANIVVQKSKRDKSQEFIMLTHRTIQDWKNDENKNVSQMGQKLAGILKNKPHSN
ncbi:MAG: DNA alkylation repair protein [Candidatus Cloacimonetes bacterium]|nr:DNA alkylation repair protein [Candidatus Cloacimonadota bacterium]